MATIGEKNIALAAAAVQFERYAKSHLEQALQALEANALSLAHDKAEKAATNLFMAINCRSATANDPVEQDQARVLTPKVYPISTGGGTAVGGMSPATSPEGTMYPVTPTPGYNS